MTPGTLGIGASSRNRGYYLEIQKTAGWKIIGTKNKGRGTLNERKKSRCEKDLPPCRSRGQEVTGRRRGERGSQVKFHIKRPHGGTWVSREICELHPVMSPGMSTKMVDTFPWGRMGGGAQGKKGRKEKRKCKKVAADAGGYFGGMEGLK